MIPEAPIHLNNEETSAWQSGYISAMNKVTNELDIIQVLAAQKQQNNKERPLSEAYIEATACLSVVNELLNTTRID